MTVLNNLLWISIYSGFLYVAIMLFRTVFKKHLSPLLLYAVWIILIARLLMPFTPDPGFRLIPQYAPPVQQVTVSVPQSADVPVDNAAIIQTSPPNIDVQTNYASVATSQQTGKTAAIPPSKHQMVFTADLGGILLFAWLMGTATMITWFLIVSLRLHNRIKMLSYPPSPPLQELAIQIQTEIHLKRNIHIAVVKDIYSPVLSAGLQPVVLIPEKIALQSGEQLEFALRHELMHLKRRDHLICLLLLLLRAVYWFNPVAWLAVRQIKTDMESLCDSLVVKQMDADGKKSYASTILGLFAEKEAKHFVLGMAMGGTRKLAERRIKGIYMRSRSGVKAKVSAILLATVLLVACFTTACQPVQATSGNKQTSAAAAESQYKEIKKLNDIVTVKYDANVVRPSAVPQATLQVRDFNDADMQKVADYFFAGRQLYAPWKLTKTQIQDDINSLQQRSKDLQAQKDAFIAQHAWAAELYKDYRYNGNFLKNDQIVQIRTKYNLSPQDEAAFWAACEEPMRNEYLIKAKGYELLSAPDTAEKQPVDIQLNEPVHFVYGPIEIGGKPMDYSGYGDGCTVWAENAGGTISMIGGLNQSDESFGYIEYFRQIWPFPDTKPLTIPMDQAQEIARQAAEAICPDLTLTASSARTYNYIFCFTRQVTGVPIVYDAYASYAYAFQKENETKINFYENIEVVVDDSGVKYLEWRAPYTDIQVTNQNAKVISMDEAKLKFETNILEILVNGKYADVNETGKMDSITLDIDRIELGLIRIQDNEGNFSLIPTWDFYGKAAAVKDSQEQIFYRFGQGQEGESLGTINALDGTEIRRSGLMQQW